MQNHQWRNRWEREKLYPKTNILYLAVLSHHQKKTFKLQIQTYNLDAVQIRGDNLHWTLSSFFIHLIHHLCMEKHGLYQMVFCLLINFYKQFFKTDILCRIFCHFQCYICTSLMLTSFIVEWQQSEIKLANSCFLRTRKKE